MLSRSLALRFAPCPARQASNYDTKTTSAAEWWFVKEPTKERLRELKLEDWPKDERLHCEESKGTPSVADAKPRTPLPIETCAVAGGFLPCAAHSQRCSLCAPSLCLHSCAFVGCRFRNLILMRNEQLQRQDAPPMQDEEFVGARLYTGPMYLKYNATLRYRGWWHMVRDKKRAGEDTQEFEDQKMKENFNRYCVSVAPGPRCPDSRCPRLALP
eukprot:6953099-Prymnesium_polylepis.3